MRGHLTWYYPPGFASLFNLIISLSLSPYYHPSSFPPPPPPTNPLKADKTDLQTKSIFIFENQSATVERTNSMLQYFFQAKAFIAFVVLCEMTMGMFSHFKDQKMNRLNR